MGLVQFQRFPHFKKIKGKPEEFKGKGRFWKQAAIT